MSPEYLEVLYQRHYRGALVRSGSSLAIWLFALAAFVSGIIGRESLAGIGLAALYLIIINPPTLLIIKGITHRLWYKYFSLFINLLEIIGYTAVIYFSGGIVASFLTPIYAGIIIYAGLTGPKRLPFILASLCSACFSLMLIIEETGLLPRQTAFATLNVPGRNQLMIFFIITGTLFGVAFIASSAAGLLKRNRDRLRQQNQELGEKAERLGAAEKALRSARDESENRVAERTGELERANRELKKEISERMRTEEALRQSESKYRDMFENVSDFLYFHDLKGDLIETNMAFKTDYGYSAEDLSHMNVRDFIPDRYKSEFDMYLKRVVEEGRSEGLMRVRTKDGRERIVEYKNSVAYEGSVPVGIRGSARDITERYKIEKALEEANERFRQVAENAEEWIWELDAAGLYTYASPVVEKILGYRPDELVGKKYCYDLIHPDDRQDAMRKGMEAFVGKEPHVEFVHRNIHKNGDTVWISTNAVPILDRAGNVIGHRGAVTNITERRKAEESLRESEKKFRELYNELKRAEEIHHSLLHTSADAIVIYDLEGIAQYINPSFTKIFGWTLEEVRGKRIPFLPDSERETTMAGIREIIEKGKAISDFETRRFTKDGRVIDVNISGSRFDNHEGRPAGMLVLLRDTSERKRLENQLRHAQKMEAIGTLASGIAHNFRNILTVIQMNSHIIQSQYKKDSRLQAIADVVSGYINRGTQLVEGMMRFSRQQTTYEFEPVNLSEMIRETHDFLSRSFDETIKVHVDIPETLHILGDAAGLSQVFMNLCGNARDAMPKGGELHISARREGEQAVVTISDTGQGMDEQILEKCFDPFFTTKEVDKGTGLGLSTAYGIVKEHLGDIKVFSEVGKGTTFRLYFPGIQPGTSAQAERPDTEVEGRGRKILIADDELEICKVMAELLETSGYRVSYVTSGREAVSKYNALAPDIVLLDRSMPGMDGLSCAERILGDDPEAKIIIISGYDEKGPSGISEKDKSRIKGYLKKPVDIKEMTTFLEKVLAE